MIPHPFTQNEDYNLKASMPAVQRIGGYFLARASSFDPLNSATGTPIGFPLERTGTEIWIT